MSKFEMTKHTLRTQAQEAYHFLVRGRKHLSWQKMLIIPISLFTLYFAFTFAAGTGSVGASSIEQYLFNWAVAFQDIAEAEGSGNGVAVDGAGNVITVGYFQDSVTFAGGAERIAAGENDVFVSKLAADGSFVWSRTAGGSNQDEAKAVAVDTDGNVYSTGRFRMTADFNPGAGGEVTSVGDDDIFVYRLNSDGSFGWVASMGGTSSDEGWDITTDSAANVYTTGYFKDTVDFDPGNGTSELTSRDATEDIFITSLDAGGNFRWAKFVSGASNRERSNSIVATDSGVYVTGYFGSAATNFNPGGSPANPNYGGDVDFFVAKYGPAGGFLWVNSIGDNGTDVGNGVAADADGNIYVTGAFEGTVDVNGTTLVGNGDGLRDVLVASYAPDGSLRWVTAFTGPARDEATGIAVSENGDVEITGFFEGTMAGGGATITSAGNRDVFVATLDSSGTIVDLVGLGSNGRDQAQAIATGSENSLYITGNFVGTVDFQPGAGNTNLSTDGAQSIFVSSWAKDIEFIPTPTPQPTATPVPGSDTNIYLPYTAKDASSSN